MRLTTLFRFLVVALLAAATVGFQPVIAQAIDNAVTVTAPQSSTIISAERTSSPTFRVSLTVADGGETDRHIEMIFSSNGTAVAKFAWRSATNYTQNYDFGLTNTKYVFNGRYFAPVTVTTYPGAPSGWSASRAVPGTYSVEISTAPATGGDPSTLAFSTAATISNLVIAAPNGVKCAPGSYNASGRWTSRAACVLTTAGYYAYSAGSTAQKTAPAGWFSVGRGTAYPTKCTYGLYQPYKGRAYCYTAPAGYYVPVVGGTSARPCAKGSFASAAGGYTCYLAQPGRYVAATAQKREIPCPTGTFSQNPGAHACTKAPAGYIVADAGSSSAAACPLGSYQNKTGQATCVLATAGHYQDIPAATGQKNCPRGFFSNLRGQRYCLAAEPGTYVNDVAQAASRPCPAGTFQSNEGGVSCDRAPLGTFVAWPRSIEPSPCPNDMFNDVLGATACKPCPASKTTGVRGSTSVAACVLDVATLGRVDFNVTQSRP